MAEKLPLLFFFFLEFCFYCFWIIFGIIFQLNDFQDFQDKPAIYIIRPSGTDGAGGDAVVAPMELHVDERQAPEGERVSKAPRISVINHCESMDRFHADEVLVPEFPNDVLDNLQDYDLRLCEESDPMDDMWDDNGEEVMRTSNIPEDLWFPFAEQEPSLAGDALESLDEIGDSYEINQLLGMGVLRSATNDEIRSHRLLSTRMVRSWRVKEREGHPWFL